MLVFATISTSLPAARRAVSAISLVMDSVALGLMTSSRRRRVDEAIVRARCDDVRCQDFAVATSSKKADFGKISFS